MTERRTRGAPGMLFAPEKAGPCCTWQDLPREAPVGSIYRCEHYRLWHAPYNDGWAPPSPVWIPVRWWNFRVLRRARKAQGKRSIHE